MATPNLWSPTANAGLASPADFDLNHIEWMSEVLQAQYSATWLPMTVMNKTPDFARGNKEAEFVVTGKIGTRRFEKGDEIYGSDKKQISRIIGLNERPYYAPIEYENLIQRFEQVNTRADLTAAMGHSLAARNEVEVMRRIVTAARAANTSPTPSEFRDGGNWYVGAADGTGIELDFAATQAGAKNVLKAIKMASIAWTKLSVKPSNRWMFIKPELFYELAEIEYLSANAATPIAGGIYGNMDIAGPKRGFHEQFNVDTPLEYMGVKIYMHNLIDADYDEEVTSLTNATAWLTDPDVAGNFSSTVGAIYQSECVGHVDLMTTSFDVRQNVGRTKNDLISAWSWTGGGSLRHECAIELVQA